MPDPFNDDKIAGADGTGIPFEPEVANVIPAPMSLRFAHDVDIINEVDDGVELPQSAYVDTTFSGTEGRADDDEVDDVNCCALNKNEALFGTYCGC